MPPLLADAAGGRYYSSPAGAPEGAVVLPPNQPRVPAPSAAARRALTLASLLVGVFWACGREVTGPANGVTTPSGLRRVGYLAVVPQFPGATGAGLGADAAPAGDTSAGARAVSVGEAGRLAQQVVSFTEVTVTLTRADGTTFTRTFQFPTNADAITVTLEVPLSASAPASGETFSLVMQYKDPAGNVVFTGGPTPVTVPPAPPAGSGPPAPTSVQIPVTYVGPGSTATSVSLAPASVVLGPGETRQLTATARDASGAVVPNAPVAFSTTVPPSIFTVSAGGLVTAGSARGSGTVTARLASGQTATTEVEVRLPASALAVTGGGGQTARSRTLLPTPVTARVTAADGGPVAGVAVSFTVASGGGSVSAATVATDATGTASVRWTLGDLVGAQTLTVSAPGLAPQTVTATATAPVATFLRLDAAPTVGRVGQALGPVTVSVLDETRTLLSTFTGPVTVALAATPAPPTGAVLGGTTTVNAVAGVATFSTLTLSPPGTYALRVTSSALPASESVVTPALTLTAGTATALRVRSGTAIPATVRAGEPLTVIVEAVDALGNLATDYTGLVGLNFVNGPDVAGTARVNAVAGVATIGPFRFRRVGSFAWAPGATGVTLPNGGRSR